MSTLKIGSITVIVNGYTTNNGLPYFQKAVPESLRGRLGKATIKIALKAENGNFAIQCHRLNQQYTDLFRAMKQIAETGKGPEQQIPSMGCGIKWLDN